MTPMARDLTPLIVQSDLSLLLETDSPLALERRGRQMFLTEEGYAYEILRPGEL
jgi:hypothetical protein